MKNFTLKISLVLLAGALSFFSCKKDTQVVDPNITPSPSTTFELLDFYSNNESVLEQIFTVNSDNYMLVQGNKGITVEMPSNAFAKLDGTPVTGNVTIELIEIVDRQSMVLLNKSTNGRMANGDISTLISGGQMKLNATQNGNQLKFRTGKSFTAKVPTNLTGGIDPNMNKFAGKVNTENNGVVWEGEDSTAIRVVQDSINGGGTTGGFSYSWTDSSFGWTNVDKFYSDPRAKTLVQVQLPTGYDNMNTSVYITYDGEPTALANFDMYDATTKLFSEHYGLIPIGLNIHFVIVAEVNGQLYSAIVPKTVVNNHLEVIPALTATTKAQLTAAVIGLP
ncbi:hypothetical protein N9488_00005 [Flavobacteriales bacterium]|nr:hypothetical protein [Flavobacteriales bacterium]